MTSQRSLPGFSLPTLFGPPPPDLLFPHLWDLDSGINSSYVRPDPTTNCNKNEAFSHGQQKNGNDKLCSSLPPKETQKKNSAIDLRLPWSPEFSRMSESRQRSSFSSDQKPLKLDPTTASAFEAYLAGNKRALAAYNEGNLDFAKLRKLSVESHECTTDRSRMANLEKRESNLECSSRSSHTSWSLSQPVSADSGEMKNLSSAPSHGAPESLSRHLRISDEEDDDDYEQEDEDHDKGDTEDAEVNSKLGQNVECVVCGDKSSGKHYGQHTCEGCKSFFKRSVRRKLTYTCRGNRQCPIDVHHRNQCQYCRFQKCVKAGMRKEAVQQGRLPPYPAMYSPFFGHPGFMNGGIPFGNVGLMGTTYYAHFISMLLRAEPLSHRGCSVTVSSLKRAGSKWFKYAQPHDRIQDKDHPNEGGKGRTGSLQGDQHTREQTDHQTEMPIRVLLTIVEWARNIPLFSDLQLSDQLSLLLSAWPELFMLNLAQSNYVLSSGNLLRSDSSRQDERSVGSVEPHRRSQSAEGIDRSIPFKPRLANDKQFSSSQIDSKTNYSARSNFDDQLGNKQTANDHVESFEDHLERIRLLQLDLAEFACLKAIVLFNSESPGLVDPVTVDCIQEKVQSALEEYDRYQYGQHQPFRFGRLLLRLPRLKQITADWLQQIFFAHLDEQNPVESLLREILLRGPAPATAPLISSHFDLLNVKSPMCSSDSFCSSLNFNLAKYCQQSGILKLHQAKIIEGARNTTQCSHSQKDDKSGVPLPEVSDGSWAAVQNALLYSSSHRRTASDLESFMAFPRTVRNNTDSVCGIHSEERITLPTNPVTHCPQSFSAALGRQSYSRTSYPPKNLPCSSSVSSQTSLMHSPIRRLYPIPENDINQPKKPKDNISGLHQSSAPFEARTHCDVPAYPLPPASQITPQEFYEHLQLKPVEFTEGECVNPFYQIPLNFGDLVPNPTTLQLYYTVMRQQFSMLKNEACTPVIPGTRTSQIHRCRESDTNLPNSPSSADRIFRS
ncbi:unnamed protein product [Calicophoron daubneyi]|uniref:Uncharacterized protein n=1 Tax=Calicophoron daubneyi TaxID=300641 RepID=A0AAV2TNQ2_CALDB